jgi:predicted HNH restriction endonuclease
MANCTKCFCLLTDETGFKRKTRKSGYQSMCRSCFNEYTVERWRQRKLEAIKYMGGECKECGYKKYFGALEFHHLDPSTKEASWNKIRLWEWSKITEELDKCVLLCANCHREVHREGN